MENGPPAHGHHAKGARIDSTELDIVVPFPVQIESEHGHHAGVVTTVTTPKVEPKARTEHVFPSQLFHAFSPTVNDFSTHNRKWKSSLSAWWGTKSCSKVKLQRGKLT